MENKITIQDLLYAYPHGYFPMASDLTGEVSWYNPDPRSIIPFLTMKMHKSVRRTIVKEEFTFRLNCAFEDVILRCADRDSTWISDELIELYCQLHYMGYAHSLETWQHGRLVGGLYGIAMGGAFFGESMFNRVSGASKAAFFKLIEHMTCRGYILLDSQFSYHHTRLLGAIEIPKSSYMKMLEKALRMDCKFHD